LADDVAFRRARQFVGRFRFASSDPDTQCLDHLVTQFSWIGHLVAFRREGKDQPTSWWKIPRSKLSGSVSAFRRLDRDPVGIRDCVDTKIERFAAPFERSLPCDPSGWGSFMQWGMIPRFHRAVCD